MKFSHMLKNRGIAFKLVLFIVLSSVLIFTLIFGYNYLFSRKIILNNVEERAKNLTNAVVNRIETILVSMEKVPENMTYFLENSTYNKETLLKIIHKVVENNPEIYGSTVAFEPYTFDKNLESFSPYFYKSGREIKYENLGKKSYRYFRWEWYRVPKELNAPVWSEPYYDEGGGNIIMATYSVPFYRTVDGRKEFDGVMTADISLKWLQDIVSSIRIFKTGYGFLISKKGTIVTHPDKNLIMNQNIITMAETAGNRKFKVIGDKMIRGKSGFVHFNDFYTGKESWIFYAPLPSTGWSLGVIFPHDEFMEDIVRLNRIVLILAVVGFFLLLIMVLLIASSITRPLRDLAKVTELIAKGKLDIDIPPARSNDETGKLTESFIHMKRSLNEYIKELTETTAAKERIESELNIAHDIQMSFIPKMFPPFPERTDFDLYATISPAREVGGDFYDYFFIDKEHLFFVIGDVSDKGVPAALFMAVTITLIRANSGKDMTSDRVLYRVNQKLSHDNESAMFVTVFCGVLNTKTGEVLYVNAGHNLPLVLREGKEPAFLEGTGDVVLGALEGIEFNIKRLILTPGDFLFMYTDGVTEAMNKKDELFSSERLLREVSTLKKRSLEDIVKGIMERVQEFSYGVPQSDDITMLALQLKGHDQNYDYTAY